MQQINSSEIIVNCIQKKRILFITTKNLSYIRNTQEINLIHCYADQSIIIGSSHKNYLVRLFTIFFKLLFQSMQNIDVVWAGFAPQLILPLFYRKFNKNHITLIEDFFISMFDTLCEDRKTFSPNGLIGKILHHIDVKTLTHADYIICDTKAHGEYFHREFNAPYEKLAVLYLEADSNIYYPMDVHRPEHLKDKYVVLYFGSVLPLQGCDVVLQAMQLLAVQKHLHFYFIGPLKQHKGRIPKSDNIEYINWLSQEELARYINYADLCLAGHFHADIDKAKRTIPGKAYIYQAIKKPMILGDNPANHELFSNDSNVRFIEMGNAAMLADTILNLSLSS